MIPCLREQVGYFLAHYKNYVYLCTQLSIQHSFNFTHQPYLL